MPQPLPVPHEAGVPDDRTQFAPGPLEGCILKIEPQLIAGWAVDLDHPETPVRLEIWIQDRLVWLGARQLATVVTGGCAGQEFCYVPARPIAAEVLKTVRVRRATDGAELARETALQRAMAAA